MAERRRDPTNSKGSNKTYTREQFVDFYGRQHGAKMWKQAPAGEVERRKDPTNPPEAKKTYTRDQFIEFYGRAEGGKIWNRAPKGEKKDKPKKEKKEKKEDAKAPAAGEYVPPKVWSPPEGFGGKFASINSHTAGARQEKKLPVGEHPLQLYSLGTPNGVKVTILLEELGVEYDAWPISIQGDQFDSGFVDINPNSKIPAMVDKTGGKDTRIFESGAILIHLAEKYGKYLPPSGPERAEVLSWVMWQMGSAPFLGGGFGHFYAYAPFKQEYPINRYAMEVKRQLDVLDKHLAKNKYIAGSEYTIADMAIWPWYGAAVLGKLYGATEFLAVHEYTNVLRWANMLAERPAVKRGKMVNRPWGPDDEKVPERHSMKDFEGKAGL